MSGAQVRRLALLLVVLTAAGCGVGSGEIATPTSEVKTVAFLRAVPGTPSAVPAFLEEMRAAGFSRGRNLVVLAEAAEEVYPDEEQATAAIDEWQRQGVDIVLAFSTTGSLLTQRLAPEVDILFISNDPTATGILTDERRPEGNATGVTYRVPPDRTLDLARRAIPGLDSIGLPLPEEDPAAAAQHQGIAEAADELGIELVVERFDGPDDVLRAISVLVERGVDGILLSNSPGASRAVAQMEVAATRHGIPVISNTPLAPWALITLAPDTEELQRQLARQAARLLMGSSVSAVPVEDPRRFLLTVNAATAAELGIEINDALLREAHDVTGP